MEYIAIQANQFKGKALGKAGYGGNRYVCVFIVKLHNGRGHLHEFEDKFACLWKAFLWRNINQAGNEDYNIDSADSDVNNEADKDDHNKFKEGKDLMSLALY